MSNRLPELGDLVSCKVTGFTGVVTSHAKHISGCDRLWVEPEVGEDNKKKEGAWLDIDMLAVTTPNAVARVSYVRQAPGGVDLPHSK